MTDPDPEVERIAELCRDSYADSLYELRPLEERWRSVARAVLDDRAAQPATPLYVVFDGPPSHESGRFVELETEDGRSVGPAESGAEWREQGGLWYLGPLFPNPEPARQAERAEPTVTDGPALAEAIRERDEARREARRTAAECDAAVADARRERDAVRVRAVTAERERDALRNLLTDAETERDGARAMVERLDTSENAQRNQRHVAERERDALRARLDAIATREPTADEIALLENEWEHAVGPVARWWWRRVRDALMTAQEPPANRVGGDRDASIISAPSMGTSCGCKPYEPCAGHQELESAFDWQERAAELLRENDALRQQLRDQAREAGELITQGREAERAAVVAWLRRLPYDTYAFVAADQIVDGDHLAAKGKP